MQQNRAHKWTTLMPFSRCFDFFCTLRFQIFKWPHGTHTSAKYGPNKPYINGRVIYSPFRLCIHLNLKKKKPY